MLPMKAVRLAMGTLLAADTTTLAPATANKMALISAAFSPSETLVVADLTLATFTGATPLSGVAGAQPTGIDPQTQDQVINISPPAGGYRWVAGDLVNLPQTIYGYALLDHTLAVLLAVQTLNTPITLQTAGQFIDIDPTKLTVVQAPIS